METIEKKVEKVDTDNSPCCFDKNGSCYAVACYSTQKCNSHDE